MTQNFDNPMAVASATVVVTPTVVVDTAIYAAADTLSNGLITISGMALQLGGSGRIEKVVIVDKAVQSVAMDLWLFTSSAVTPAAVNAAHSVSDAHALTCIGVIPILAAAYSASALNSVATATLATQNLPLAYKCAATETSLYGILVVRSGTPTYGATSDIQLSIQAALY